MADYDSNIIKPVDNLQNVTGLAPTRRREERSRRRQLNQENKENPEQQEQHPDKPVDEQVTEDTRENWNGRNSIGNRIDYHA
jgi:hypothetical protein